MDYRSTIINISILLLSLTVHEFFHAFIANEMGDPTARLMGRMTLNPLKHLDIMGTLAMIVTRMIGWAKPVPINPMNFRDRRKGMIAVSLAGPLSNLGLAFMFGIFFMTYKKVLPGLTLSFDVATTIAQILIYGVIINITLAVFNMIPLYPLDGSKVLIEILPVSIRTGVATFLQRYSTIILLVLIITNVTDYILGPIQEFVLNMLI